MRPFCCVQFVYMVFQPTKVMKPDQLLDQLIANFLKLAINK